MTKSYFQKVVALWMFSWELSAISEGNSSFGKLYFKVATLNRALHSDFVLCSEEQGDYCSILFYNIIYPILLTGNYAAHLCFLKSVRFKKKFAQKFVKLEQRRGYCDSVRNAVKLSDTR